MRFFFCTVYNHEEILACPASKSLSTFTNNSFLPVKFLNLIRMCWTLILFYFKTCQTSQEGLAFENNELSWKTKSTKSSGIQWQALTYRILFLLKLHILSLRTTLAIKKIYIYFVLNLPLSIENKFSLDYTAHYFSWSTNLLDYCLCTNTIHG